MYELYFKDKNRGFDNIKNNFNHSNFRCKLPDELVNFYSYSSGGRLKKTCSRIYFDDTYYDFDSILKPEEVIIFFDFMRELEELYSIPYKLSDRMIPIASHDELFICIGYANEIMNNIFYIDLTPGMYMPGKIEEIPVIKIADNLDDLFKKLRPYEY